LKDFYKLLYIETKNSLKTLIKDKDKNKETLIKKNTFYLEKLWIFLVLLMITFNIFLYAHNTFNKEILRKKELKSNKIKVIYKNIGNSETIEEIENNLEEQNKNTSIGFLGSYKKAIKFFTPVFDSFISNTADKN